MENHHFSWENPLLMAIFNSYVKLPEGRGYGCGFKTYEFPMLGGDKHPFPYQLCMK
jgi:hypothetical protein